MGLRERKKAATRRRIAEAAHRLFAERGFQGVTVVEVARAADVAEATLFNYFPTKGDLFYSGLEAFGARLVEAVRDRSDGESALAAFRRALLADTGQLDRIAGGDADALDRARTTARVVVDSPALEVRERQVLLGIAAELADAIGPVAPDPVPRAVANALMGVHIALVEYTRARLLADDRPATLAADVRARAHEALELLEHGLAAFAPAAPATPD